MNEYTGYMGGDKSYSAMRKARRSSLEKWIDKRQEEDELKKQEEETKRYAEHVKRQNLSKGLREDGSEKDLGEKAGDFFEGLGQGLWKTAAQGGQGLVELGSSVISGQKDTEWSKALAKWGDDADNWGKSVNANGIGSFIGGLPGGIIKGVSDNIGYMARASKNAPEMIAATIAASSDNPEARKYAINLQKELQKKTFGEDVVRDDKTAAENDKNMLFEGIARTLGTAVDIATFGSGSLGKGTVKQAVQEGKKQIVKKAAKSALENVVTDVPLSAMTQMARGKDVTAESLRDEAIVSALGGGIMSGLGSASRNRSNAKNIANRVDVDTKRSGGATIGGDGKAVTEGFAFAPSKSTETIIDADKFSDKDVREFIKNNRRALSDPDNKVGAWESDGKVYLDISRVIKDKDAAIKEAAANEQLAIYDLKAGEEIPVGTIDSNGKYTANSNSSTSGEHLALEAGFKDNAHYDQEIQRFQNREFTEDDDVWADRTVQLEDGQIVDVNALEREYRLNERSMRDLKEQSEGFNSDKPDLERWTHMQDKIKELETRNAEIQNTVSGAATTQDIPARQLDNNKVRERWKALSEEAERARQYHYNTSGRAPEDIRAEIDALEQGNIPEDMRQGITHYDNADDVLDNKNLPSEIRDVANEVLTDKDYAQFQLSQLTTPENAQTRKMELSQEFAEQRAALEGLDEVQYKYEMEKLESEYLDELKAVDRTLEHDAEQVNSLMDALQEIEKRERDVVQAANWEMTNRADEFMRVDEAKLAERKQALEAELDIAEKYYSQTAAVDRVVESGQSVAEVAKTDGQVHQAVVDDVEKALRTADASNKVTQVLGLRSPSRILHSLGLDKVFDKIADAEQVVREKTMADMRTIADISIAIKDKKVDIDSLFDYIEGKSDDIYGSDLEIANQIKAFFNEKRVGMEAIGIKGRDNYMPHFFDKEDKEVVRLFNLKEGGDISFASFKQRIDGNDNYSRDLAKVMRIYAEGYNRKVYLEPALKSLNDVKIIKGANQALADWVDEYIAQLRGSAKPGMIEQAYNAAIDKALGTNKFTSGMVGGNHYRSSLSTARVYSSVAALGFNVSTAVRNLSQMVNTTAAFGGKNSTVGLAKAVKALTLGRESAEAQALKSAGVFDGGMTHNWSKELNDMILGSGSSNKGLKIVKTGVDASLSMMKYSEIFLRAQTYFAAEADGIAKGLTGKELADYARRGVLKTQFDTSKLDMPTKLNGPGARSLTQFATFSLKQTEFLGSLAIDTFKDPKTGKYKLVPNKENVGRFISATMLGAGITAVLQPLIGFDPAEFNPLSQQLGEKTAADSIYRSPLVKLAIGDGKGKMGLFDVFNANDDMETGEALKEFWGDNYSSLIPFGAQGKKTMEGLQLIQTGESKNTKGNTRFLYNDQDNVGENIKALLFGQYATKAGREWLNGDKMSLTENQTKQIQGLPQDKKNQYYDYYMQSKKEIETSFSNGKTEAVQKIKEAARTNEALARQMAAEYNAKMEANMSNYFKKHDTMPQRLMDEMYNSLRIDVSSQIKNAKRKPSLKTLQREARYSEDDYAEYDE